MTDLCIKYRETGHVDRIHLHDRSTVSENKNEAIDLLIDQFGDIFGCDGLAFRFPYGHYIKLAWLDIPEDID
jgi:hypothetical protein